MIVPDPGRHRGKDVEKFVEEYEIQSNLVRGTIEIAFAGKADFFVD